MFIYFWGNILAWNCILFPKKPLCWSLPCTKMRKAGRASPVNLQRKSAGGMRKFQLPLGHSCSPGRDAASVPFSWSSLQSSSCLELEIQIPSSFSVVCAVDHQLHTPNFSSLSFSDSALSWLVSLLVNCFLLPEAGIEGKSHKDQFLAPPSPLNRCIY